MKFLTSSGWTYKIGSSIRNTYKFSQLYVPGAWPVFYENDTLATVIPIQFPSLAKFHEEWINWMELNSVSDHLKVGLDQIILPASLKNASWNEVLLHLVPSWTQKGI